jgi:hypothetical protein
MKCPANICSLVDAVNGLTIDSLVAKAEQLNPDILFIDGVYLMLDQVTGDANTPQASDQALPWIEACSPEVRHSSSSHYRRLCYGR